MVDQNCGKKQKLIFSGFKKMKVGTLYLRNRVGLVIGSIYKKENSFPESKNVEKRTTFKEFALEVNFVITNI